MKQNELLARNGSGMGLVSLWSVQPNQKSEIFHSAMVLGLQKRWLVVYFRKHWRLRVRKHTKSRTFATEWIGNRFHELSLGRNDRAGVGISKIEVLANNSNKNNGKSMIVPFFPWFWPRRGSRSVNNFDLSSFPPPSHNVLIVWTSCRLQASQPASSRWQGLLNEYDLTVRIFS